MDSPILLSYNWPQAFLRANYEHLRVLTVFVRLLVSRIYVAELNGTNQKTIYAAKESIHGIAVDPING